MRLFVPKLEKFQFKEILKAQAMHYRESRIIWDIWKAIFYNPHGREIIERMYGQGLIQILIFLNYLWILAYHPRLYKDNFSIPFMLYSGQRANLDKIKSLSRRCHPDYLPT